MVVTFTSVFETLVFGHSSESYWAALSSGTVYYDVQSGSNFQVCRQHPSLALSRCCLLGNSTQIRCLFSEYDLNFIFLGVIIYYYLTLRSNFITLFTCAKSLWGQKKFLTHHFSFHSYSKRTQFVDWKWKAALEWCCTSLYCNTWLKNSFDPA